MQVRIKETGLVYATLNDAIAAAQTAGLTTYTLEILGPVNEVDNVPITGNVSIVGSGGAQTITLPPGRYISVPSGGNLTLGSGNSTSPVTISNMVRVQGGGININDGIELVVPNGTAVAMDNGSTGAMTGGKIDANRGISLTDGSQIIKISGGAIEATGEAIFMAGNGTSIGEISGGSFEQTATSYSGSGDALYISNNARVGLISGGYFEAQANNAILVARGARIDKISGGEFVANRYSATGNGYPDANEAVRVISDSGYPPSSIGEVSGGHFRGTNHGILVITFTSSVPGIIEKITGGVFDVANVGIQCDRFSYIYEISGGYLTTRQGILNSGTINLITGDVYIAASGSYAIYNYEGGTIDEIAGGMFLSYTGNYSYAMANSGTVKLISGGTFIGTYSAINCDALVKGHLDEITGGVFWGQGGVAIRLYYPVTLLEPGLNTLVGAGRYMGLNGVIFNNDALVQFPVNSSTGITYHMSTGTLPVDGISGTEFKYLTLDMPYGFHNVDVIDSYAANSGAGIYSDGEEVTIRAGVRPGYVFDGWTTTLPDGALANPNSPDTTFIMPESNVVATANWRALASSNVTVKCSFSQFSGAGTYLEGDTVTIYAGSRGDRCEFQTWTSQNPNVVFANPNDATTTFIMPDTPVTVVAGWLCEPKMTAQIALAQVISSISMEELALSHILNSEGEKIQYVLGTLEGGSGLDGPPSFNDLFRINMSAKELVATVSISQMFLLGKLSSVVGFLRTAAASEGECG
ncbi:MAG: hypothetical protein FWG10_00025 [Eubacteriaceae bacterium]|nr:hypothetical protein [Eubacteriaceae bacterium]